MGAYADGIVGYAQAGWPCIIPVPPLDKFPPPVGYTGAAGRDTDPLQLVAFATTHADYSIALRMPDGVIGIDVDHYDKAVEQPDGSTKTVSKRGADTLAGYEAKWGALPATWSSTARGTTEGPGPSRILFFRVPPQRYGTKLDGDVEIIQRHHRYAVVAPSVHHSTGTAYGWYDPAGLVSELPPKPIELPELPQGWVTGLLETATDQGPAASDPMAGQHLLDQLVVDDRDECADVTGARLLALEQTARAGQGSRHDTMTARIHHLVQLGAHGHTGVGTAIAELHAIWLQQTAGEDRGPEFGQMLRTSARKAVTLVGANQVSRDPCVLDRGFSVPPTIPADNRPDDPDNEVLDEPLQDPRWWSIREVIGAAAFDPITDLDQTIAQAVLDRMYPELRYAYDTGNWLLRLPDRWEPQGDLSGWAIAELGWLMPQGDSDKEASSEEKARASRRARLLSHKGASAIAGKIKVLVASGAHPSAIRLATLDSEPHVLWAGGMPFDLRRSTDGPQLARIDLATPHLHTATVAPERRATPLWDAFVSSVWPDEEIRAWALRVLSIALTGYSDRALPILQGEKGRGKTQVVNLLMSVLGSYAHAANPKLLGATDSHDTIVYDLRGRRLSFIDEGPREGRLGQERLKQLTGGAEITANQMRQDAITFRPTHTLVLTANDEPVLTDPAIRDRVRLIPCDGDPDAVRRTRGAIGHINSRNWRAEAPGVLALMMTEAARWLADPDSALTVAAPESIRYRAEILSAEQDPVKRWLDEDTEPHQPGSPTGDLYAAFRVYCQRQGLRIDSVPTAHKWGREVTKHGYPSLDVRAGDRVSKWRPLRIKNSWSTSVPVAAMSPETVRSASVADSAGESQQQNPRSEGSCSGSSGSSPSISLLAPHVRTPAPAHDVQGDEPDMPATPQQTATHAQNDQQDALPGLPEPQPTATALTKAQRTKIEKAEAKVRLVDDLTGERIELPALTLRDGTVRPISRPDANALLATITDTDDQVLTVDVETTGYPVGHEFYALQTAQLGNDSFAVVYDTDDPEQQADIRHHLEQAAYLQAHSASADGVPLTVAGLVEWESFWDRMYDTVIPAKLNDPSSTGSDPGLKQISAYVLGSDATSTAAEAARGDLFKAAGWITETKVDTPLERSGWAQVNKRGTTMIRYAGCDVLDTGSIGRRMPALPPEIWHRERVTQRMTARIAHTGVPIDGPRVDRMLAEHTTLRDDFGAQIRERFAIDNPGSSKQVATKLGEMGVRLPRTKPSRAHPDGQPSVAEGVLEALKIQPLPDEARPLIDQLLDYRHHATVVGTFLEPYHHLVHRGDGRARPTVYTLGTDTGRMSCVRPNFQQLPREGGVRQIITADPGHLLISADFSSVEIRVAAALSQDPNLIRMLEEGLDPHAMAAEIVFGPNFTKANRYSVKRGVFGRIYGGGVDTLAKQMGVTVEVAQRLIDTIDRLWPRLSQWSAEIRDGVKYGQTTFTAYSGRIIHLPTGAAYAAPNYCIQGTARELLVDALLRWRETHWGSAILWPVHDEVDAMVREAEAQDATLELVRCMETELNGVRIVAEPSEPAPAWQDAA